MNISGGVCRRIKCPVPVGTVIGSVVDEQEPEIVPELPPVKEPVQEFEPVSGFASSPPFEP